MLAAKFHEISDTIEDSIGTVCFLHGINGHAFDTWSCLPSNRESCWPKWLARTFPNIGVFTIEYDAKLVGQGMRIDEVAAYLLTLMSTRDSFKKKPYIFVCHSMGGLVAKQILLYAHADQKRNIVKNYCGTLFVATPHRGSSVASWADFLLPGMMIGQKLRDLSSQTAYIEYLFRSYRKIFGNGDTKHFNYYETKSTAQIKIVNPVSADCGIPEVENIPLPFNHIDICKFKGVDDERFKVVIDNVKNFFDGKIDVANVEITSPVESEFHLLRFDLSHYLHGFLASFCGMIIPPLLWITSSITRQGNWADLPIHLEQYGLQIIFGLSLMALFSIPIAYFLKNASIIRHGVWGLGLSTAIVLFVYLLT